MPPSIAALCYAILIAGLFWLDRNRAARTSAALWIPVLWFWIACSRSVTQWLQMETVASADQVQEGSPIDRLVLACLLLAGVVVLINRRKWVGRVLRANLPLVAFFLYCLISLLWSDYPDVAFKRWNRAVGDLVMVLIVLTDRAPLAALQRLLARLAYVLIPLSVLFIKYYPNLGRGYGQWLGEVQYYGVTTNKNTLGAICLCLGLGTLWRLVSTYRDRQAAGRARHMIAQAVILVMVLWMFRIVDAMTSLSCFLMGSILILAANVRWVRRRPMTVSLLIVAMVAVSASVLLFGASPDALKSMGRNPTLTGRTEVWDTLISLVQNPLMGTGFESFWLGPRLQKMWAKYWWHPGEAHNGYLEIYLNLGWAGTILLAVVLGAAYRRVFTAWRAGLATGGLGLAYFVVGLVFNLTEAAFFRIEAPVWLFFLLGVVSVPAISRLKPRPTAQSSPQNSDLLELSPQTAGAARASAG